MNRIRTFYELYRIRIICGVAIVFIIVSVAVLLRQSIAPPQPVQTIAPPVVEHTTDTPALPTHVFVDIKGAVKEPNVYEMATDARVKDVIQRAGGLLPEADETLINLAQKVTDQMVIYVAVEGEQTTAIAGHAGSDSPTKVNLNEAKLEQLLTVPGIGPAKAASYYCIS